MTVLHDRDGQFEQPEGNAEALTVEETAELETAYMRILEIYDTVIGDGTNLTNRVYRNRVSPFEEELDALEARVLELEAKAGLENRLADNCQDEDDDLYDDDVD